MQTRVVSASDAWRWRGVAWAGWLDWGRGRATARGESAHRQMPKSEMGGFDFAFAFGFRFGSRSRSVDGGRGARGLYLCHHASSSTPSPIRRFTRSPKKDAWRTGETQPMFNNRSPGRAGSVVEPCAEGAHPEL